MTELQNIMPIINEILRHETGDIPVCEPVKLLGGMVNQVYSVSLPGYKRVIRLNPDSVNVFRKEQWAMEQAAAKGVRVPFVQAVGQHENLSYMLMQEIEGVPARLHKGDLQAIFHEAGRMIKMVNNVMVEGCGYHLQLEPIPRFTEGWTEGICGERKFIFADDKPLIRIGALNHDQLKKAEEFIEPMMDWDDRLPRLSHCDVSPGNLMVSSEGDVYVIDWTSARGGPAPYLDLGNIVVSLGNNDHIKAFLNGYGLDKNECNHARADIHRIGLKNVLCAAVWAASVNHPEMEKFIVDVRARAHKILEAVDGPLLRNHPALAF